MLDGCTACLPSFFLVDVGFSGTLILNKGEVGYFLYGTYSGAWVTPSLDFRPD